MKFDIVYTGLFVISLLVTLISFRLMLWGDGPISDLFRSGKKDYRIIKTDPCQVETLQEGVELATSDSPCDLVKVVDPSGYKIPDDVDEFSIHYNTINGKQKKPKYYKRIDGVFKEVSKTTTKEQAANKGDRN